jgi:hypothetical protein
MMNVSNKKAGLGIVAVAVALMGSAVFADNMAKPGGPGMGGPGHGPRGGHMGMMMQPIFVFADADANKDGKVTPEEFAAYRVSQIAVIDVDKDGKISTEELATMNLKAMQAIAQARAEHMVKALDADGDGKLSAAELLMMPVQPDAFVLIDTNKDGVIDQAEADAARQMGRPGPRDGRGPGNDGPGMGGHWMKHHKMHGPDNGPAQGMDEPNGDGEN